MIESVIGFPTIFDWLFVLGGCLGMLTHYLKRYVAGEITVSPMEYFIKNNWAASLLSTIAFAMSMFAALGSVPKEINFYILVYLSFVTGYTTDSAFNRIDDDKAKVDEQLHKGFSQHFDAGFSFNKDDFKGMPNARVRTQDLDLDID